MANFYICCGFCYRFASPQTQLEGTRRSHDSLTRGCFTEDYPSLLTLAALNSTPGGLVFWMRGGCHHGCLNLN